MQIDTEINLQKCAAHEGMQRNMFDTHSLPNHNRDYILSKEFIKICENIFEKVSEIFRNFDNLTREKNAECVDLGKC